MGASTTTELLSHIIYCQPVASLDKGRTYSWYFCYRLLHTRRYFSPNRSGWKHGVLLMQYNIVLLAKSFTTGILKSLLRRGEWKYLKNGATWLLPFAQYYRLWIDCVKKQLLIFRIEKQFYTTFKSTSCLHFRSNPLKHFTEKAFRLLSNPLCKNTIVKILQNPCPVRIWAN